MRTCTCNQNKDSKPLACCSNFRMCIGFKIPLKSASSRYTKSSTSEAPSSIKWCIVVSTTSLVKFGSKFFRNFSMTFISENEIDIETLKCEWLNNKLCYIMNYSSKSAYLSTITRLLPMV